MSACLQIGIVYICTVVLLTVIVTVSSRFSTDRMQVFGWASAVALVLFVVSTFTRLLLIPYNADETRRDFLLTGDEPAYFMTALSIAHDGDINLANNASKKDYLLFQRQPYIGSGFNFYNFLSHKRLDHKKDTWGDARYMRHRPGTSVLLAPAFFWADHNQRFWSYTLISFCFALFGCFAIYYSNQVIKIPLPAVLLGFIVCSFAPPVYYYLNQAYPEIPAGILLALICLLFLAPANRWQVPFFCAALVIWFSDRTILATLIICAGGFFSLSTKKQKVAAVLILGTSGLLFAVYCRHRFGVPYPVSHNTVMGFSYDKIPVRMVQILFDARYGWVWHFPVILLFPAVVWQLVTDRKMTVNQVSIICALVATLVLIAAFDDWGGGTCPRGRYFVIPQLLFMVLIFIWCRQNKGNRVRFFWLILLGAVSLTQLFWLARNPRWWYVDYHPFFAWMDIHVSIFHLPFLPDNADAAEWMKLFRLIPFLLLPSLSCIWLLREKSNHKSNTDQ